MEINVLPRLDGIKLTSGHLCVLPKYTLSRKEFLPTVSAISELFDRIWGLELKPACDVKPDESYFTPLTEAQNGVPKKEGDDAKDAKDSLLGIFIDYDASLDSGECIIEADRACRIAAYDESGLFRAASILAQIAERTCDKLIRIPKCVISDKPDSPFRGFLLDCARRWHPVDYLYRYVDLCSLISINRFIIHFTDDESYTLPSDVFPRLPSEGRHYTKEELRALDSYAASRGVMIVPEIDMPGHSAQFALKYPDIFGRCGIMDANDDVFDALARLYEEAASFFPSSEFIHVGGDEAVLGRWLDSEKTAEYMKKNSIPDIVALYGHFVGRVCDEVLKLGKTPIVWEGFGKSANDIVSKDVLVISWENHYQTAVELSDAGFRLLNASWRPLYCVSPWQKWSPEEILTDWNKYSWNHWWEQSKAYEHGVALPRDAAVDGGIYCAWGDYLKNYESSRLACQLEFASVKPRLCAVAEKLWNDADADVEKFNASYGAITSLLERVYGDNPFRGTL